MANVDLDYSSQKTYGKTRQKKMDLRIDMTPMVDLGFLLIAFFIFTTEMTKPNATNLIMPHDGESIKSAESKSLTILIGNKSDLYYYFGREEVAVKQQLIKQSGYTDFEIGGLIGQKQKSLGQDKDDLLVLIKAANNSNYKNVVDILNEMLIKGVKRYAIVDLSEDEKAFLDAR